MSFIAYNGHPVSLRTIPRMLYTQWLGTLVKIKALLHLSDQKWSKGTEVQSSDDSLAKIKHPLFQYMPDYLMTFSYLFFFYVMFLTHDAIALPDIDILKEQTSAPKKDYTLMARDFGVIADDGKDDAVALNKLINSVQDNSIIILPKGRLDLYTRINITRSNITIKGFSKKETIIVSHLKTADEAAIYVHGERLNKIGSLKRKTKHADSIINAELKKSENLKWIQIREANSQEFLDSINAVVWRKEYPYLRQEITSIESIHNDLVYLNNALTTIFTSNGTQIYALKMVENIRLEKFTIKQEVEGHSIEESYGVYQNMFPLNMVDMISFFYVVNSNVSDVNIINAGSHPLSFENIYACEAKNLYVDGAWNKGKEGNGYVKFSRTFNSKISNSTIKNIRHLTIQWSSANNRFENLNMFVDINLHGGYSHDNSIENIKFNVPFSHKWNGIVLTPPNAKWAPPDGPRNFAQDITISK